MKVHTIESDRYKLVTRLSDREMETEVLATQSHEVFYKALANLFIFAYFSVFPPISCKHANLNTNQLKTTTKNPPVQPTPQKTTPLSLTLKCNLSSSIYKSLRTKS